MNNNFFRRLIPIIFGVILLNVSIVPFVSCISVKSQTNFVNQSTPINIDWWPKFRHDTNQIGFSTSSAPEIDDVLWSYQTDNIITSSPAVLNGKVYVGSWDKKLYCFDMMNGDILWNYTTDGKITASPAVNNGKVYFGSQDTTFYCLDADDGSQIWQFDTDFMIESSPTIKDNRVFFGSSGGSLYCLNANNGSLIWNYSTGNVILSTPALMDNRVYFGTLDGDFFCLDNIDGDFVWSYSTTGGIESSPAVNDGKVYFGSYDEYIYCLDAYNGSFIWSYNTGGEVHSSPAIVYGNVYIGSSDQGIFCLNAETGDLVWNYLISGGVWSPPSIAEGKVYFGGDPCCGAPAYFHCYDAYTGERIWKYNIGEQSAMKSSPAIAAGKVFIGAGNGIVYAFGGSELYADAHGPYTGIEDIPIQFEGSAYGGKPNYTWYWDFGDGESSNEQNPTYSYTSGGDYIVILTVTDDNDNVAIDETSAFIENINYPPIKPVIEGPLNGKIGEEYTYCIVASDPDNDTLYVLWNWGDGTGSGWSGPFESGTEVYESHIWNETGTFTISVTVMDEFGESVTAYKEVTMPRKKMITNPFLRFLKNHLNIFPLLQLVIQQIGLYS